MRAYWTVSRRAAGRRGAIGRFENGQAMVLIGVALIALVGIIGVVTDVSFMHDQRNLMQTAADSAAVAGAQELSYGDVVVAGKADAASNGYTDGANSVTVAINNPPTSGPNAGNANYVEAIVSKPEPTYFLRVLGFSSLNVSARAVASSGGGQNCIVVLDPSASGAMTASGSVSVSSKCGLLVDSTSASALSSNGSASVSASSIGVVGGYSGGGFTPTPKTGVVAATDPLSYLQGPTVGSCAHTNFSLSGNSGTASSPYQLYSGTYCGGISVSGNAYLKFNSGTYILAGGGMSLNSNSVSTGTGVTFYNTTGTGGYGGISLKGTANFSAPTTGSLSGILFFQDRSIPAGSAASSITGGSTSTFDGSLYFPTTTLTYTGNSSSSGYSIVVVNRLVINGNSSVSNNYSSLANGSPIKGTVLAE